ncbi:MAG TPA: CAP domain-containing protein [Ktedonobacteraceae bacterium]|nr:CAP domain-containing protein [Ktedonobacteraceae bacterium]
MNRKLWYLVGLLLLVPLLVACGQNAQHLPTRPISSDSLVINQPPTPTPGLTVVQQVATPTAGHQGTTPNGPAPYGPPPAPTALDNQLTQQLFNQINQDRAARGLYPYTWNATLAAGARLHSWNMYHCGFSHTCPNGEDQCTRIAGEGFAGYTDCGECIGLAGPSNPPWAHVYAVQESMINEPPTGWHRIHLTSTTLHRVGVGVYVDPTGWVWFTEDLVS